MPKPWTCSLRKSGGLGVKEALGCRSLWTLFALETDCSVPLCDILVPQLCRERGSLARSEKNSDFWVLSFIPQQKYDTELRGFPNIIRSLQITLDGGLRNPGASFVALGREALSSR